MKLGILIGSVLPDSGIFDEKSILTDYGYPSSGFIHENAGPNELLLIARHGIPASIPPHMVNHRANIVALKREGVEAIISICSTGSLRSDMKIPSFAVPVDYVDMFSNYTLVDEGIRHITPGLDPGLQSGIISACRNSGIDPVANVVYVQTRGPRLETRAEIRILSGWGDLVGMNLGPEATLSKEMDMPVGSLLTVDNYANGVVDEKLDYRDIIEGAKTRYRKVKEILSRF